MTIYDLGFSKELYRDVVSSNNILIFNSLKDSLDPLLIKSGTMTGVDITSTGAGSFGSLVNSSLSWHVDSVGRMWQGDFDTYAEALADGAYTAIGLGGITRFPGTMTSGSIVPRANNLLICGSNDFAWSAVYAYTYVDKCNNYDKLDAISLLKGVKSKGIDEKGQDKIDHSTLPDFVKEGKDSRNLGKYVDLLASAIKQLELRLIKLEK